MLLPCLLTCVPLTLAQDPRPSQDSPAKPLINKEAQQAIDSGLAFLAKQQANDGSWGKCQPGVATGDGGGKNQVVSNPGVFS